VLFPAAQRSQEADAAFQRLVKAFSDAVMTQDASRVDSASEEGRRVADDLKSISAIPELQPSRAGEAAKLASTVDGFVGDARTVYGGVLTNSGNLTEESQQKMGDLASRTNSLKNALQQMKEGCSQDLRDSLSALEKRSAEQRRLMLLLFLTTLIFAGVVVHLTIRRSIAGPLMVVIRQLDHIAQGDVSANMSAEYLRRGDEIGLLAKGMQTMSVSLRQILKDITDGIRVLSTSSAELQVNSGEMSDGSRVASDKTHAVAGAAEEMSANVESVASHMEQTTTNLTDVTAATDKMAGTIGEIAGNSERARLITQEATRKATRISEQMNQLGEAAKQIGQVTDAITQISSQTNLLALNATIEAARAGSAGKGFAVVATEIKGLAQQAAAATDDIKNRIAGVQKSTAEGIAEIGTITQVISDVSKIVESIARAIEKQSMMTKEIAHNIGEASTGVRHVNERISEASHTTSQIAREIAGVDHAAGQMAKGSDRVKASAGELSSAAERLQTTIGRFKV
jgi:methyl-accepting chemotaxis protein